MANNKDNSPILMLDRRTFIKGAAVGVGAAFFAPLTFGAIAPPRSGGHLKIGLSAGATTDNLDPSKLGNNAIRNITMQMRNMLVELDAKGDPIPELAESWEAHDGAMEWTFNIRKGVEFHNGKSLDADDVIYSLNLHRGEGSKSGATGIMTNIADIKKISGHQVLIRLNSPSADLHALLSDYHLQIVPAGTTDFSDGNGTGGYILEVHEPGVRTLTRRNPNYWKAGRAHVASVESLGINDDSARTSALQTGQVHLIDAVSPKTAQFLERVKGVQLQRGIGGGQHYTLVMRTDMEPFSDNNLRLAMKYAVDRDAVLNKVLRGYGSLGNDHPAPASSPFFNTALAQRTYDPDKAKFYAKKAGYNGEVLQLSASDAAFAGAVDTAILFKESAAKAGINVDVRRVPSDGYWNNVWKQVPFCMSNWKGRPTLDMIMSTAYHSEAKWNDGYWKNKHFDELLVKARGELDVVTRRTMYAEAQELIHNEGHNIIPMFADVLDATRDVVKGFEPSPHYGLSGSRAPERVWLED